MHDVVIGEKEDIFSVFTVRALMQFEGCRLSAGGGLTACNGAIDDHCK